MKNKLQKGVIVFALIGLIFSCVTSNEVAGNRGIQKRKYTKGFYFDPKGKIGGGLEDNNVANTESNLENKSAFSEETVLPSMELTSTYQAENEVIAPVANEVAVVNEAPQATNPSFSHSSTEVRENLKNDKKVLGTKNTTYIQSEKKLIATKKAKNDNSTTSDDAILYYILAILLPPVAVGLVTDWNKRQVVISLILWILGAVICGVIYALIVVHNNV
jgi:uncharacterized membrane protein YqaE (UPF0057 family)